MGYLAIYGLQDVPIRSHHCRGLRESHVHDVIITREAPNYRLNNGYASAAGCAPPEILAARNRVAVIISLASTDTFSASHTHIYSSSASLAVSACRRRNP